MSENLIEPIQGQIPDSEKKLISFVLGCFNEAGNVGELYLAIKAVMAPFARYRYEMIFIDNASTDGTVAILKQLAANDVNLKIIVNVRNFGHIRSPYHALLQAAGDCVIAMASDFQDPPALIPEFISKWEQGYKVVMGVKEVTDESWLMSAIRRRYYRFLNRISEIDLINDATGFGLYDRVIIQTLRKMDDAYPYFRGLISEIGFDIARVPFHKAARKWGVTKNNFYVLYDIAMLGITNHSKLPLRLAAMAGFCMSAGALVVAVGYLIAKLLFWNFFPAGTIPILISLFFFSSVQLFFIGMLGEYIGTIYTQVLRRPLVIERERVNFDSMLPVEPRSSPSATQST